MSGFDALDDFAGPGGWDEGARMVGLKTVGIEWDMAACQTAKAAGHARLRADVAAYPSEPFAGIPGYIASPPCQAWSTAGTKGGHRDQHLCHQLANRMADGDDDLTWTEWDDPRSSLICQPIRRVRDLRPEWIALEEVRGVIGLWEHFARILRGWGYHVWTGVLCAADFGVGQERYRAVLMAHRSRPIGPPEPTHTEHPQGAGLFGLDRHGWVSMREALAGAIPAHYTVDRRQNSRGPRGTTVPCALRAVTDPAPTLTGKSGTQWILGPGWGWTDKPAPTVCAGAGGKYTGAEWGGRTVRAAMYAAHGTPAWEARADAERPSDLIRITPQEAGLLQSFPADYPWQGNRSKQYEQAGNAVPPLLAAHVLAALTGKALEAVA